MLPTSLLIANRGEIAIRIARAAAELGIRTVAVFSEDDAQSLHIRRTDDARPLHGTGARAYLDTEQILAVARESDCDAIHPGYGFLSENAAFARRCAEESITFVGPRAELLELFGDKLKARALAESSGIPVLPAAPAANAAEARRFFASLRNVHSMMIKAVAGGGGRGMRAVHRADDIDEAVARCQSEARASFGNSDVYVEQLMPRARHIEVQIAGDRAGSVIHVFERECSVQRRNQKIVEIAPSPGLPEPVRERVIAAALRLAIAARYENLGTFEFLVDAADPDAEPGFAFIEANPRLQVEHTVTEEVTGIDLVKLQLELAGGSSLAALGVSQSQIVPRGFAIQMRVNAESMNADGTTKPSGGRLSAFEPPSGPGIRVDTYAYSGYTTNPNFDSLMAKLIVHSPSSDFADVLKRAYRAVCEFRIEGIANNIDFLANLLRHADFAAHRVHTRFVEDHIAELAAAANGAHRRLYFEPATTASSGGSPPSQLAGAKVNAGDPLAVLAYGKSGAGAAVATTAVRLPVAPVEVAGPAGTTPVRAPMQGTIVSIDVREGDQVRAGAALLVMEAMKMEHVIKAPVSGVVRMVAIAKGDAVFEGHPLVFIEESHVEAGESELAEEVDLDRIRPDLAEVQERHAIGLDSARPEAVARRRKTNQRTTRENVADLVDQGSTFIEYGPTVIAAQRRRRTIEDLVKNTPADGMVAGIGQINGDLFGESKSQCIVMSYDYTVLAGTQGGQNHRKKDRMFEIALKSRLPVVFFTEGGGGRPGDTDGVGVAGLDCLAFMYWGELSGLVPLIAINSGRCFAGNAALLGCADVVIAAANSNIGMGGPAMIEGGGLGVFRPEEVGPMSVQVPNGVVDIAVAGEREAVAVARRYLSYFQGPLNDWQCADQRKLRTIIPENRLRIYDVREVIDTLADSGSVLELRRGFGRGMVTALTRVEGRPIGMVANNPEHLAGAIDSDGADKAARFMQLCDAFDIPVLFLCDCPGIMVGPEVEKTALVRHASRMFVTGASLTVPFFTIVLRKGYGLGAQAMAGGSFKAGIFTIAWPTGEFGGMGLEGAVKLGYRKELEAAEGEARTKLYNEMVARMYERGKALNTATTFEIDDVIDPFDSRKWIMAALKSAPPPTPRTGKKRPCIDTW